MNRIARKGIGVEPTFLAQIEDRASGRKGAHTVLQKPSGGSEWTPSPTLWRGKNKALESGLTIPAELQQVGDGVQPPEAKLAKVDAGPSDESGTPSETRH
jgi:hypothetical protein